MLGEEGDDEGVGMLGKEGEDEGVEYGCLGRRERMRE